MLTPAQKATLKTDILASPDSLALYTDGNLSGLADLYNAVASPAFIVWKTLVTREEVLLNGFDWVRVDNLSVGKARIWDWLFVNGVIDPSKTNVRAGIEETWKGTAQDLAVRDAVYAHCKRPCTRFERVFATGVGTDPTPGLMGVVGPLSFTELIGL